jgi:hypothetical protein
MRKMLEERYRRIVMNRGVGASPDAQLIWALLAVLVALLFTFADQLHDSISSLLSSVPDHL